MTSLAAPPYTLHAALIDALERDQPELALEHALLQLSRGGNLPLVLATLKALVRAGLAGVGVKLLQSLSGLLTAEPQFASLAERLAALPSGEWPRDLIQQRQQANAERLRRTHSHLGELLDAMLARPLPFRIFESAAGNRHVIRDDCGSRLDFVFPFSDQHAQATAAKLPTDSLSASFLLVGAPSAALWNRLLSIRTQGGYEPPIDVLESDESVFAVWLALIDPHVFSADRVSLFMGPDCLERYRYVLIDQPWRNLPTHCTMNARARWQPPCIDKRFHDEVAAARTEKQRQSRIALQSLYSPKSVDFWQKRFRRALDRTEADPLRIAGFTNRYSTVIQHVMRDLGSAFERRGCKFSLITQPNASCANIDVAGELEKNPCDLIVVVNHLRSEYAQAIPSNIPYVCWIQDHMEALWDRKAGQSVGELDLVVGHAPQVMAQLYDYPIERFLPSSNLTDSFTYTDAPVEERDKDRFRCDVSYVSHASGSVDELIEQIVTGSIAPFRRMLEHARILIEERLNSTGWMTSTELVAAMLRAERDSGIPSLTPEVRRTRVFPQFTRLYDRMFRHQALQWVARWARLRGKSFKLFGHGWERHLSLREFACGEVPKGDDLRCLCQASLINLQVNGYSSLHQRMLDAISSGGFVLSRFNPADFARLACANVHKRIHERFLRSLDELWRLRRSNSHVDAECAELERLTGLRISPLHDDARMRHAELVRESNGMSDWLTDEGLFNALATMKFMPTRAAADLPGFARTTFRAESELLELLDKHSQSQDSRTEIATSMRTSVRQHDTYDSLVEKILLHFSGAQATP